MRRHIGAYADPNSPAAADEEFLNAVASMFDRSIWNATPLPQHRFRPQPIPEPGRNQPCPCGSRRKYKHCCARVPQLPITADEMWPLVFDALSADQRESALNTAGVPASVFVNAAQQWVDEDKPSKAAGLLEPMFFPRFTRTDEQAEYAFDLLCDIYDRLNYNRKKEKLIQHVLATAPARRCGPECGNA
jgi:hypothetical protein